MDMVCTFTAYLFLVTCIATNCTAKSRGTTSWKDVITTKRNTIHINGRMQGSEKVNIHVNVTILAKTSSEECCINNFVESKGHANIIKRLFDLENPCKGFAKVCSSRKCNKNQHEQLSGTCSMKIIYRQTCNMSNACHSAISDEVMPQCRTTKNGGQTCDIAQINVFFTCTDWDQLNRTWKGPGELLCSCSCTPSERKGACKKKCPDIIGCACKVESKNCTPPTTTITTPMTNGPTTSDTVLVGGVVGGLFGGVVITVVIVFLCRACSSRRRHTEDEDGAGTKESHTHLRLIHTTSGKSPPGTNAVTSQVPDLIKVSAVQQASSAPSDVYDVIKEGDDNQLGVNPSTCDQGDYVDITDDMTGVGVYSQAQAAPGMAVLGGTLQPAAEYFVLEKDDPTDGDYNKLVRDGATETATDVKGTYNRLVRDGATETGTDVQGTYNRLVRDGATETGTDVQGTYNRLVREGATKTGTDVQGTYNRLGREGATETTTDVQGTYNRLGREGATETTTDVQGTYNRLGREGATETGTDVQGTYNRLGREGATETGTDVQGTCNRLGREGATEAGTDVQGTYNRLGREGATEAGTDVQDTYNRLGREGATETGTDVQGTYNRLGREGATGTTTDVQGTYNRLGREGATETTTDIQGTYNKFGSMADDNDDNEPGGKNGTAADYFVLEKPEDTSNKLAQTAPGMAVQDDMPPSAAEYFVLEKDDPTDGDYNKLVRDGATETTTDVQDTYNKLGSMADDNDDNEQAGNNGTAADYFVLEKPLTANWKGNAPQRKNKKLTPNLEGRHPRESEPPDDPGGLSPEYFILEDQTQPDST